MSKHRVENRLAEIRKSRGVAAAELANGVGVTRQTIYAIEAGTYLPNTELALLLAQVLEVSVDQLFSLALDSPQATESLSVQVLSPSQDHGQITKGQPMRVCQVGSQWVGVPVSATPYYMPEADGVIDRTTNTSTKLSIFAKDDAAQKRLVIAGCDPATSLLSHMVERASGVEIVSAAASSKLALTWLKQGKVHVAGSHLEDPRTGEFNLPYIRQQFPKQDMLVVTFARWEEGFVVAKGNPKRIRKTEDLARRGVRMVNREPGSGSRALLEKLLTGAGIAAEKVQGFRQVAYGHLAAAYCVAAGEVDVCLATRSAAQTFHLDFVPLHSARYDMVMHQATAELPSVKVFMDVLQRATLRRKLEILAGYDTTLTGSLLAA